MYLISALIIGIACGIIPIILGTIKEELELGMLGFITAIGSAIMDGLYLACLVTAVFVIFILKDIHSNAPKQVLADIIPFTPKKDS